MTKLHQLGLPRASRPSPDWLGGKGLLDWSWAVNRLAAERNYWLTTIRRDLFPQARPVWGIWSDWGLSLSDGHGGVQRARGGPPFPVTVHVDSAIDVVILAGRLHRVGNEVSLPVGLADHALQQYNEKYSWELEAGGLNFVVRPQRSYAWRAEDVETATRWEFE